MNVSLHALKFNTTPKFNESSELISYLTCEERCMDPSMLFCFKIWLKETHIFDIETFRKWVRLDPEENNLHNFGPGI